MKYTKLIFSALVAVMFFACHPAEVIQFGVEIGKIIPDENEWKKYRKKSG